MTRLTVTALAITVLSAALTPTAPADETSTAHDPQFENKTLWPKLTGKEYFLETDWPKGRLMVWAHPGRDGRYGGRDSLDPTDPDNWLEDGKPCREVVLDENTDLLLPAAETHYSVGFRGSSIRETVRHVTVEKNAAFVGGGDGVGRSIHGNVWIKECGGIDSQGATRFLGSKHVFFRNDNTLQTACGTGRGDGIMSSQYFTFNKEDNASVEFLGHVTVLDEFRIYGCTVIVGIDSTLQPGRNASPSIEQGGVLALLDGARFESWNNDFTSPEMTVTDGTIQGGLPERPLTRSCTFGLAFKNHTAAEYAGPGDDPRQQFGRVPSLVVLAGGLRSISQDLGRARLVFTVMEDQAICPEPGSERYEKEIDRWPEKEQLFRWMRALPQGTDCFLAQDVAVDGVEFDHLRAGGVLYQDPATKARWKNLFFGPRCQADETRLFTRLDGLERGARY